MDLDSVRAATRTITDVTPGQTVASTTVSSGNTLNVSAGGTALVAVIEKGGIETVFGSDVAPQINDGGYQYVWGTATGAIAFDPGVQVVAPGGAAISTTLSGGE